MRLLLSGIALPKSCLVPLIILLLLIFGLLVAFSRKWCEDKLYFLVILNFNSCFTFLGCWEQPPKSNGQVCLLCVIGMCIPSGSLRIWHALLLLSDLMGLTFFRKCLNMTHLKGFQPRQPWITPTLTALISLNSELLLSRVSSTAMVTSL